MTQVTDPQPSNAPSDTDLIAAVLRLLAASDEPLTVSKLRAQLPSSLRQAFADELAEVLKRQVAAGVLHQYPPYRSQQDRFWDRSMPVHVAALLRVNLEEGPLPWSQLRRRLPAYALALAEQVLQDQVAQGRLHKHPRAESRGSERFGAQPPDPKEYLQQEISAVFHRLEQLGFSTARVRAAALELLHDEEWAPTPPAPRNQPPADDAERPAQPGRPEPFESMLAGGKPPAGAPAQSEQSSS